MLVIIWKAALSHGLGYFINSISNTRQATISLMKERGEIQIL